MSGIAALAAAASAAQKMPGNAAPANQVRPTTPVAAAQNAKPAGGAVLRLSSPTKPATGQGTPSSPTTTPKVISIQKTGQVGGAPQVLTLIRTPQGALLAPVSIISDEF